MNIPADVLDVQHAASDPAPSAWVAANAGSGKTHVLAQRVIRLLLRGTPPEKILCLTYTKAAAANMANRVFDDAREMDAALRRASSTPRSPRSRAAGRMRQRRVHARRLFAQALDTPGGLKVQTIHAFCTRLLHQFPFEADVAARFEVLEERTRSELIDRLRMGVLLEAAAKPDSDLGRALGDRDHGRGGPDLRRGDRRGDRAGTRSSRRGSRMPAASRRRSRSCRARSASSRRRRRRRSQQEFFSGSLIANGRISGRHRRAGAGLEGRQGARCALRLAAAARRQRARSRSTSRSSARPSSSRARTSSARAFARQHPPLFQRLLAEQERVCALIARRRAVETRERTAALVTIAHEVIARYRAEKNRRGLLDYDDLIDKTLHLLAEQRAAWVHYKLDLGVDHVLIDEAQDTSDRAVGDRAAPDRRIHGRARVRARSRARCSRSATRSNRSSRSRARSRRSSPGCTSGIIASTFEQAGLRFEEVKFQVLVPLRASSCCRRSTRCSAASRPMRGLTEVPGATVHRGGARQRAGRGRAVADDRAGREARDRGLGRAVRRDAGDKPARALARNGSRAPCRRWIARARVGRRGPRRAAPGDILVLVRQRGALFEAVIRELKKRRHRGRGRRPADADRAHRRDGPDGARRRAAAAAMTTSRWRAC